MTHFVLSQTQHLSLILKSFLLFLCVFMLSACGTLHEYHSPLMSKAELAKEIDQKYEGDANTYIRKVSFVNPKGSWWPAYVRFAHEERTDLLDVLKERGWEPNGRIHNAYNHTLRYAIGHREHSSRGVGSVQAVKTLLDYGVDPDNLATDCESKYQCSSALTSVIVWGEPGMIKPILKASDKPHWKEVHHGVIDDDRWEAVRNHQPTGKKAMEWAVMRGMHLDNFKNNRAAFEKAFADAGYGKSYKVGMQRLQEHNAQKKARLAKARASSGGGGDWTKDLMAMGAGALIGAAVVGEADFLGELGGMDTLGQVGQALTTNTVGGGTMGGGTGASGSTNANAGGGQKFSINEQYRATCPDGRKTSQAVPIKANSPACAKAMRTLARAAGCNLYEEMSAANAAYQSACASEMFQ